MCKRRVHQITPLRLTIAHFMLATAAHLCWRVVVQMSGSSQRKLDSTLGRTLISGPHHQICQLLPLPVPSVNFYHQQSSIITPNASTLSSTIIKTITPNEVQNVKHSYQLSES